MHRKIDPAIRQGFVDFLGEQPFAANFRQRTVLHGVAGGADHMVLEHVHAAQHGAEPGQHVKEGVGLHQGQGGATRADTQWQESIMRAHSRGEVRGRRVRVGHGRVLLPRR